LSFAEFSGAQQQILSAFLVPFCVPDHGEVKQAAHLSDGFIKTALELALGSLRFAAPLVDHPDVIMRHQVLGCEGDRLLEVVKRLLQLPGVKQ